MSDSEATDLVMFITVDGAPGRLGTDEQYGKVRDYFTRKKEEVSA